MAKFVPEEQEEPMHTLCRMVIDTKYEDLPDNVVNHAKQIILDTIAVTIGGSAMEGIPAIVDLVKDRGGKQESIIPFYGGKVPASDRTCRAGRATGSTSLAKYFIHYRHIFFFIKSDGSIWTNTNAGLAATADILVHHRRGNLNGNAAPAYPGQDTGRSCIGL